MLEVKQKINLYLPRFQPAKLSSEVKVLCASTLVSLLALFSLSAIIFSVNNSIKSEIVEVREEKEDLDKALTRAISKIPNAVADSNLINRIAREKIVLIKKEQVRDYLYQDRIGKGENFTNLVDQLAKQSVQGIWLSKFEILNKGKDIQLFGYVKTPNEISKYIEMLGTQEAYRGRNFQQIKIKKSDRTWSEFYISTLTRDDALDIENPQEVDG